MPSSSSISTGLVKPNSRIEAAICATCWSPCVRAFLAQGISAAHLLLARDRHEPLANPTCGREHLGVRDELGLRRVHLLLDFLARRFIE